MMLFRFLGTDLLVATTRCAEDGTESVFFAYLVNALIKPVPTFAIFQVEQIFLLVRVRRKRRKRNSDQAHLHPAVKKFSKYFCRRF